MNGTTMNDYSKGSVCASTKAARYIAARGV